MPKKTREEKMAAALRRLKQQVAGQQIPTTPAVERTPTVLEPAPPPQQQPPTPAGYSLQDLKAKSASAPQPIKTVEDHYNYAYVTADLRKIAVLAAVAVALEVVLNLTTRASFVKLILRKFGVEI